MTLKNIIRSLVCGLCMVSALSVRANDPEDYMYVPDVQLDESGKGTVVVWLKTNVDEYNGILMDIYLPKGFEIEKNSRGKYIFTWNTEDDVVVDHSATTADKTTDNGDPYITFLGVSFTASYILPGDNWLYKFNIQAPAGYDTTEYGYFRRLTFAEGVVAEHYFDDVEYAIKPFEIMTGVETVTVADGSDREMYDLHGRRIENPEMAAPGVYIERSGQSSRKVVVR